MSGGQGMSGSAATGKGALGTGALGTGALGTGALGTGAAGTGAAGPALAGAERRLQRQFLLALGGVLVVLGIVAAELGGPVALGAYLLVVAALVALGVRRARAVAARRTDRPEGRTCSCCTSTVYDPVEIR